MLLISIMNGKFHYQFTFLRKYLELDLQIIFQSSPCITAESHLLSVNILFMCKKNMTIWFPIYAIPPFKTQSI